MLAPPRPAKRTPINQVSEQFVQGTEVWVPRGELLRHHSGAYGPHTEFARVSALKTFRRGEGLPGAVWSTQRPEVWQELGSHFVRAEVAKASGIEAAIGFPIFKGNEIAAVVVLLCGERTRASGCIEVWNTNPDLRLLEHAGGYYGKLEQFGRLSRLLQFQSGMGLPGMAWESGLPQVIEHEGSSNAFIRASIARDYGIETGIAIPLFRGHEVAHVVVLLSTAATPVARAFEVWVPNGDTLTRRSSHYSRELEAFGKASAPRAFKLGEGLPGRTQEAELPVVFDRPRSFAGSTDGGDGDLGPTSGIGIPVIDSGRVTAVACLLS
jgi:hypothetical protein